MYESNESGERLDYMMKERFFKPVFLWVVASAIFTLNAAEFKVGPSDQSPPKEISDSIRPLLAAKPIELQDGGKAILQFWPVKSLPLKSKPSSANTALNSIAETTLLGAISVSGDGLKDYKDNDISKGVYTARFILQPQNGDHLGTSEFNYFIALVGAADDKEPGSFTKFTPLVKASGKQTSSGHPLIISLQPVDSAAETPSLSTPAAEHKAIRLKLSGNAGGEKSDVPFDLVYEGHGHIQ